MYKKVNVVMLPTNEKANDCPILYFPKTKRLNKRTYSDEELQAGKGLIKLEYTTNHLYILSDEEIKEDNYIYNSEKEPSIIKYYGKGSLRGWKKIISSTDKSLSWIEHDDTVPYPKGKQHFLPQIPQSFIEYFVSEYNKGNIITYVMVEYETIIDWNNYTTIPVGNGGATHKEKQQLKINPKDNTINIKPIKDSWSREEVVQLFNKIFATDIIDANVKKVDFDKWIEENL